MDLTLLDVAGALDFALSRLALGGDARFRDRLIVGDAGLLYRLARGELGLLGFGFLDRAFPRHFGALQGAAHFDVAFLVEAGVFALALDVERLTLGLEVAGADADHRILFDVIAQLTLRLDVFHQLRQALGVETV